MTSMMSRATNCCSSLTAITSLIASLMVMAAPAQAADSYPTKPIRIIVGTAPGGSADVVARILAQKLQQPERLGQPVVVENKPGGALLIGMAAVANAAPDGY